jgi:uncharacterized protein
MEFTPLPAIAAWRHVEAREGFETVYIETTTTGVRIQGQTAAVEDGIAWSVGYDIVLDPDWHSQRAHVWNLSAAGARAVTLERVGPGRWRVDGHVRADLDGCFDVDLESSACTNTMPVHRMRLGVGDATDAPAAYVRATDLSVERLEQRYTRLGDGVDHEPRFDYESPAFDFGCVLIYDASGLVVDYPGIAQRAH